MSQAQSADIPVLSPQAEAKRLRGLRNANGVGPWFGHRVFRRLILMVAATRMKGKIHGLHQLPQPSPTYYPPRYRRKGDSHISDYPFVVAPNHQHMLDIPLTGFIPRPMAWPLEARLCSLDVAEVAEPASGLYSVHA